MRGPPTQAPMPPPTTAPTGPATTAPAPAPIAAPVTVRSPAFAVIGSETIAKAAIPANIILRMIPSILSRQDNAGAYKVFLYFFF